MEKKYRIVETDERKPTSFDQYYTNLGLIDFNDKHGEFWDDTDSFELYPNWWLEEVEDDNDDSSELWRMLLKVTDLLELIGKETGNETPLTLADSRRIISKYANEFLNQK